MNLDTATDKTFRQLEDEAQEVWTSRAEVGGYVRDGYDQLCRRTRAVWDVTYSENLPYAGDHTGRFEEPFAVLFQGLLSFTGGEWERDYDSNGAGPANHTSPWERDHIETDLFVPATELPNSLLEVDRVTYDDYLIGPVHSSRVKRADGRYLYTVGPTTAYVLDEDGVFVIRKVPVPDGRADTFEHSGTYGTLRRASSDEFGSGEPVLGSWGGLRQAPEHFPAGPGRGTPRRVYRDGKNVRVEVFRRGTDPGSAQFEMPDHYVRYVVFYAMSKALKREGPGQNLKMAGHYMARFESGVARIIRRMSRTTAARVGHFGLTKPRPFRKPIVQLPWPYPRVNW